MRIFTSYLCFGHRKLGPTGYCLCSSLLVYKFAGWLFSLRSSYYPNCILQWGENLVKLMNLHHHITQKHKVHRSNIHWVPNYFPNIVTGDHFLFYAIHNCFQFCHTVFLAYHVHTIQRLCQHSFYFLEICNPRWRWIVVTKTHFYEKGHISQGNKSYVGIICEWCAHDMPERQC